MTLRTPDAPSQQLPNRHFDTVRRPKLSRPEPHPSFLLAVVAGRDAGLVRVIDAASTHRVLLGTSPACFLRLTDPTVSRRHAALAIVDDALQILDLGSTNGSNVNGVTVKEAYLHGGESVSAGATVLSVQRGAPRFVVELKGTAFGRAVGESRAMRLLYPVLGLLAQGDDPVLLEGEAGTGKELIAEELHLASARAAGPFVTLESSILSADRIEPTLFGTDTIVGLLAQARGGTLFIDEVGHLPLDAQVRLRDALESQRDVRVIAATRRDLDRDVTGGTFSEALMFVLLAGRVELPPLRSRDGDVALLARHFWGELSDSSGELPSDFLPRFDTYNWPGNVRELRAAVLARMNQGELAEWKRGGAPFGGRSADFISAVIDDDLPFTRARERVVSEFERRYVDRVLKRCQGNIREAARASGLAHRYFQLVRARVR